MQRILKRKRKSDSGFQVEIGSGGRDGDIRNQVKQAIRFIGRYKKEIARLSRFDIDQKQLVFGVIWEKNIAAKTHSFPVALLKASGDSGVDIVLRDYGYVEFRLEN